MDATNNRIHSRRAANGITMFRGAVMAGFLASTLLTVLPSATFAEGRGGDQRDEKGRHSLVQHPYADNAVKNPFAILQAQIDALKAQVNQLTVNTVSKGTVDSLATALGTAQNAISTLQTSVQGLEAKPAGIANLDQYVKIDTNPINGVAGPHILITGANVHVRSGSGATDNNSVPFTGVGNLIIGYN